MTKSNWHSKTMYKNAFMYLHRKAAEHGWVRDDLWWAKGDRFQRQPATIHLPEARASPHHCFEYEELTSYRLIFSVNRKGALCRKF